MCSLEPFASLHCAHVILLLLDKSKRGSKTGFAATQMPEILRAAALRVRGPA
jgi:hypothetical protein